MQIKIQIDTMKKDNGQVFYRASLTPVMDWEGEWREYRQDALTEGSQMLVEYLTFDDSPLMTEAEAEKEAAEQIAFLQWEYIDVHDETSEPWYKAKHPLASYQKTLSQVEDQLRSVLPYRSLSDVGNTSMIIQNLLPKRTYFLGGLGYIHKGDGNPISVSEMETALSEIEIWEGVESIARVRSAWETMKDYLQ